MSVHQKGQRWVVRWRDDGRQRSRAFDTKREAQAFDRLSHVEANTTETYHQLARRLERQYPGTRWSVEVDETAR